MLCEWKRGFKIGSFERVKPLKGCQIWQFLLVQNPKFSSSADQGGQQFQKFDSLFQKKILVMPLQVKMMMMNCFCGMVGHRKALYPYFQLKPLSKILTIVNLQHAASKIWTCAEPEFRLSWMKLCRSDNHCTTAPHICLLYLHVSRKLTVHSMRIFILMQETRLQNWFGDILRRH